MPKSVAGSAGPGATFALNTTYYFPFAFSILSNLTSTEANVQRIQAIAGSFSGLFVNVTANSLSSASTTVRTRINGGNGNIVVTIGAGLTGLFYDTTHSDAIAVSDLVCGSVAVGSGGSGSITISTITSDFSATSGHASLLGARKYNGNSWSANNTTFPQPFSGSSVGSAVTEADLSFKSTKGVTFQNLQTYVTANGRSTACQVSLVVNGSTGSQVIQVGAGLTGLFQDNTNTDTVSAGDLFNARLRTNSGGGTLTATGFLVTETSASENSNNVYFYANGVTRAASATANFFRILGSFDLTGTTEANFQIPHGFPVTVTNLMLYISANTYSGTTTVVLRKNGVDGNNTLTIGAGMTGLFEDTTHSDVFTETDLIDISIVGGTSGSITPTWGGMLETPITAIPRSRAYFYG